MNITKNTITNKDLYTQKCSIYELEENIDHLGLWDIVLSQTLTADFCVTYFWLKDDIYAKDKEDTEICLQDILAWQRHLTEADIYGCNAYTCNAYTCNAYTCNAYTCNAYTCTAK